MTAGRPRKPTNLKVLHGDRTDRVNREEPVPGQVDVLPPEWLDGVGLELWAQLSPDLIAQGVLTAWDVEAFAMVCDSVRLFREARDRVAAEGLTVMGSMGSVIKHPLLQVQRDAATTFAQFGSRFGLTPADRAKISIGGSDGKPKGAERLLS